MVDIATGYKDINDVTPQIELVHGLSTTKLDRQIQVYKAFLPEGGYSGAKNILGTAVGSVTYTADNAEIVPFTSIGGVVGNYNRTISPSGGVVIPEDGTYMVTARWIFQPIGNDVPVVPPATKDSITVAQFGQTALLSFISYAESETSSKQFVWYSSKRFDLANDFIDTTFSSDFNKGNVLWLQAAHKWDGVTFPVTCAVFITKLS